VTFHENLEMVAIDGIADYYDLTNSKNPDYLDEVVEDEVPTNERDDYLEGINALFSSDHSQAFFF
jgi:hypothetical protein